MDGPGGSRAPGSRFSNGLKGKIDGMEGFTITTSGAMLSPLSLFLQADIVVKGVMVGLLLASVWTWAIILSHGVKFRRIAKASDGFERDFWKAEDIDRFYDGP